MHGFRGHSAGFTDPDRQARERWGRTWDPTGARRPAGPLLALRGLDVAIVFAVLALVLAMRA
ncbi:MAG: hypothetical protein ACNA8R_07335 [Nitriliruptoraceae bacterium]